MANRIHDIGIARQIGTYSDAVEAPASARWLITAGTPGLDAGGKVPSDFGAQAELAWATSSPCSSAPTCRSMTS